MFEFDNGLAMYLSASLALSIVILTLIGFFFSWPSCTVDKRASSHHISNYTYAGDKWEKSRELQFFYHLSFLAEERVGLLN